MFLSCGYDPGTGQLSPFLTLASFASFARTPIRAEESTRAKLAKDAKLKGIKHDEIAHVAVEWAFALNKQLAPELLRNWMIHEHASDRHPNLCVLCANPLSGPGIDSRQGSKGKVVKDPVPNSAQLRRKHPFSTGCVSLTPCHG